MTSRRLGIVLISVGLVGMIGSAWAVAARPGSRSGSWVGVAIGSRAGPTCDVPRLPGQTVDVILSDRGGMMAGERMMGVAESPSVVGAGTVLFRVWNAGMMVHELVVMPLPESGAGTRPADADGHVNEEGSFGEASSSCGEGSGEGIAPGAASWVSLDLPTGQYELICNFSGHYALGMFAELDVQ